jgi:Tol biopolymer transport system component
MVLKSAAGVALICASSATAANPAAKEPRYADPVIFQRAEVDESTGKTVVGGKLWIMDLDGSGLRQLTFGSTYDEHPSLYSDQQHVLYSEFDANSLDRQAGARLIRVNIYSGAREVVAEAAGCALHHASLSPIDDQLMYHRDCGKRQSQWVGWGPGSYEVAMRATNGVAIPGAVIAMHEKNTGVSPREVALVRIEGQGKGTTAAFLTDDKVLHRRGAISPDGKWLAWQTNAAGPEDEIFFANIDGSDARNLTNAKGNDGHPWFSRNGKWIVFESDRSGQWEIWRIELASGKQEQLTSGGKKYVSTRARM